MVTLYFSTFLPSLPPLILIQYLSFWFFSPTISPSLASFPPIFNSYYFSRKPHFQAFPFFLRKYPLPLGGIKWQKKRSVFETIRMTKTQHFCADFSYFKMAKKFQVFFPLESINFTNFHYRVFFYETSGLIREKADLNSNFIYSL